MEIHRPHDRFFRSFFSDPTHLTGLLQNTVSPEVLATLRLETLRPEPGTWIDRQNREHLSDLAFSVEVLPNDSELHPVAPEALPTSHRHAKVYILVEHKSYRDPMALLQLLRYMVQIWTKERGRADRSFNLTPIIPVLVYHGPAGHAPGSFADLFPTDLPEPLKRYRLTFGVDIQNLSTVSRTALTGDPATRTALWMLRTAHRTIDERLHELAIILQGAADQLTPESYHTLGQYLYDTSELSLEQIRDKITELVHEEHIKEGLLTTTEQLIKHGEEIGIRKGFQEGEEASLRSLALRMMEDGEPMEKIIRYTNLSREEILALRDS